MLKLENNNVLSTEVLVTDRTSSKTSSTQSESEQTPKSPRFLPIYPHQFRSELFPLPLTPTPIQISQKVSQRAVSWLITVCWSKGMSEECLWSAVLLYYVCRGKGRIRKQELELRMLGCLSLALKMTDRTHSPRQLASLTQSTPADIVLAEAEILQLVDYNLILPHQLSQVPCWLGMSQERRDRVLMVCELLMLQDYDIFVNRGKLQSIVRMLDGQEVEDGQERVGELRHLLLLKESRVILNKYSSKIDTEAFRARFL